MNNLEQKAQQSSREYAMLNKQVTLLQQEDYEAGFIAASVSLEMKLEFARKQLRQLIVVAAEQKDVYSVSIARFALEVLK